MFPYIKKREKSTDIIKLRMQFFAMQILRMAFKKQYSTLAVNYYHESFAVNFEAEIVCGNRFNILTINMIANKV